MSAQKSTDAASKPIVFSWRRFLLHASILGIGLLLGWMTWYFSKPQSVRFHETKADEYLTVAVTPHIEIALDTGSSIAITDRQPLFMELFKGNVYFNISRNAMEQIRIKVGEALIEDAGTRFSIRMNKDGSRIVSVAEGQLKINVASGAYQISALEQADFDNVKISRHRLISEREVAPWTTGWNSGF
jgi:ferric-dicitrate binding protein FerR (iron transport regulator)